MNCFLLYLFLFSFPILVISSSISSPFKNLNAITSELVKKNIVTGVKDTETEILEETLIACLGEIFTTIENHISTEKEYSLACKSIQTNIDSIFSHFAKFEVAYSSSIFIPKEADFFATFKDLQTKTSLSFSFLSIYSNLVAAITGKLSEGPFRTKNTIQIICKTIQFHTKFYDGENSGEFKNILDYLFSLQNNVTDFSETIHALSEILKDSEFYDLNRPKAKDILNLYLACLSKYVYTENISILLENDHPIRALEIIQHFDLDSRIFQNWVIFYARFLPFIIPDRASSSYKLLAKVTVKRIVSLEADEIYGLISNQVLLAHLFKCPEFIGKLKEVFVKYPNVFKYLTRISELNFQTVSNALSAYAIAKKRIETILKISNHFDNISAINFSSNSSTIELSKMTEELRAINQKDFNIFSQADLNNIYTKLYDVFHEFFVIQLHWKDADTFPLCKIFIQLFKKLNITSETLKSELEVISDKFTKYYVDLYKDSLELPSLVTMTEHLAEMPFQFLPREKRFRYFCTLTQNWAMDVTIMREFWKTLEELDWGDHSLISLNLAQRLKNYSNMKKYADCDLKSNEKQDLKDLIQFFKSEKLLSKTELAIASNIIPSIPSN